MFTTEQWQALKNELTNMAVHGSREHWEAQAYPAAFENVFKRKPTEDELKMVRERLPQGPVSEDDEIL
jgi:hypothetical protein